jgi:K+:H+ antiporter subunit KhtT
MDVTETVLPGVGLRYEFTLSDGRRICVVASRKETFTISAFDGPDPDVGRPVLRLEEGEAATLAEILGAPRIAVKIADLSKEVPGLLSEQIHLGTSSPYVGRKLGDTKARTRTGASIVAVVRDDTVLASPGPDEDLMPDDVLVVIGTVEGIQALRDLLLSS